MKNNIDEIVHQNICCGCGVCSVICPSKAIELNTNISGYIQPVVDNNLCVGCGICRKVCPKNETCNDIKQKGTGAVRYDDFLKELRNKIKKAYICYALDDTVRLEGQSGGAVTALLGYLLDTKRIETAYINLFDSEANRNKMAGVEKKKDLIAGAGSFYSQSSIEKCIRDEKSAAVLLGCQAKGLSKIAKLNWKVPEYKIGLFCGGNFSAKYIERLEGADRNKGVRGFRFRDKKEGGWPGNLVYWTDTERIVVDKKVRMKEKPFFHCNGCNYCLERLNDECDVSFGDPWGLEDLCTDKKRGYSVALVYTESGRKLINDLIEASYMQAEEIDPQLVIDGQGVNARYIEDYVNHVRKNNLGLSGMADMYFQKNLYSARTNILFHCLMLMYRAVSGLIGILHRSKRK